MRIVNTMIGIFTGVLAVAIGTLTLVASGMRPPDAALLWLCALALYCAGATVARS